MKKELSDKEPLIYFDGECALCNFSVAYIYRVDIEKKFYFASLQGSTAAHYLPKDLIHSETLNTIYLSYNSKLYNKSDAILLILSLLPKKRFKFFSYFLSLIPKTLRDSMYMLISKNRHLFLTRPKNEGCPILPPDIRARLLS